MHKNTCYTQHIIHEVKKACKTLFMSWQYKMGCWRYCVKIVIGRNKDWGCCNWAHKRTLSESVCRQVWCVLLHCLCSLWGIGKIRQCSYCKCAWVRRMDRSGLCVIHVAASTEQWDKSSVENEKCSQRLRNDRKPQQQSRWVTGIITDMSQSRRPDLNPLTLWALSIT